MLWIKGDKGDMTATCKCNETDSHTPGEKYDKGNGWVNDRTGVGTVV